MPQHKMRLVTMGQYGYTLSCNIATGEYMIGYKGEEIFLDKDYWEILEIFKMLHERYKNQEKRRQNQADTEKFCLRKGSQMAGDLKSIGVHKLGQDNCEYYQCVDCCTEYPRIDGAVQCNGHPIELCPWCRTDTKEWQNGRGIQGEATLGDTKSLIQCAFGSNFVNGGNLLWSRQTHGKFLPHPNYFALKKGLRKSVAIMQSLIQCYLCYENARLAFFEEKRGLNIQHNIEQGID